MRWRWWFVSHLLSCEAQTSRHAQHPPLPQPRQIPPGHHPMREIKQSNPIQSNSIQSNLIQFNSIQFNIIFQFYLLPQARRTSTTTHTGSFRLSVAVSRQSRPPQTHLPSTTKLTFEMEQHVRLVILEHLRDELSVHVLSVDFLPSASIPTSIHPSNSSHSESYVKRFIQDHHSLIELLL